MSQAQQRDTKQSQRPREMMLLLAMVALTLLARLWGITDETAWWDEIFGLWQSEAETFGEYWSLFYRFDPTTTMAPVYFLGQFCWSRIFGATVMSLRLYSVLLGSLAVLPLFFIGRRLFGVTAGWVACLCYALALPHIFYAQEIRHHGLVTTLCAYSLWTFLIAVDRTQKRWLALHFMVNALLLWSSIMTVFMFAVEGIYLLLFYLRPLGRFTVWVIVHSVILATLLLWVKIQAVAKPFWLAPPTNRELVNAVVVMVGGRFSNDNPSPYLPFSFSLELILVGLFFCCVVYVCWSSLRGQDESPGQAIPFRTTFLLLAWFVLPIGLLFAGAVLYKPVFLYRYLLYASFPLYLFVGAAVGRVRRPLSKALIVCTLVVLFGYQHTVRLNSPFRPDYRAASDHILADTAVGREGGAVPLLVLKRSANGLPLQYLNVIEEGGIHYAYGGGDLHQKSVELVAEHGTAWVLMWRWDRMDEFETHLRTNSIDSVLTRFGGMPPLYVYRLTAVDE